MNCRPDRLCLRDYSVTLNVTPSWRASKATSRRPAFRSCWRSKPPGSKQRGGMLHSHVPPRSSWIECHKIEPLRPALERHEIGVAGAIQERRRHRWPDAVELGLVEDLVAQVARMAAAQVALRFRVMLLQQVA